MASTDKQFILTGAQVEALSKVFKFADVEETGFVDVATISTLAVQLLGAQLSESEKETINSKAENKAEKGLLSYQNFIEIMKETMQAMTHWGKLKTVLEGYVGFDTVQEQIRKKSLKRGFEFNLMVVGQKFVIYNLEFMKRLDKCVNIVPVIAKADTLTIEEREAFRRRLREDIQKNNINIYPILERQDLDEEEARTTSRIREQLPFAVIGSDRYVTVSGKPVLGRKTKWGLIEVENKNHCEFAQLRDMLIKTHMQDLKEVTDSIHYESYRRKRLTEERNSTEIVLTNGVVNMDCQESKI
ncbi:PREDICTED: septin-9-like [Acropora digitifera]|uniref:septin-9-like n=1 Tax=Acropora digitifera TaxID=70779 RepID=UPI00077A4AA2|nr:PREDICTED: septin-9-like [Acropora digitifera]